MTMKFLAKFLICFSIFIQTISRRLDDSFDSFIVSNECPNDWIEKNNKCFYISKYSSTWIKVRVISFKKLSQILI